MHMSRPEIARVTGARYLVLPLVLVFVNALCRVPSADEDPNLVTSLRFSPGAFDSFRRNAEMKYSLKSPATLSIYIVRRDSSGEEPIVKTLAEDLSETRGSHAITWLGDTDRRLFAPTGVYFGVVQLRRQRFETMVQVFHF